MSDKNKRFRNHCNIDVAIDREDNSVVVDISYKDEMLEPPQCWTRQVYDGACVVEELLRQGIAVGRPTIGGHLQLDNTSSHAKYPSTTASYVFPLIVPPQTVAENDVVEESVAPAANPVVDKKRRTRSKTK
jgi:hypothetical protein